MLERKRRSRLHIVIKQWFVLKGWIVYYVACWGEWCLFLGLSQMLWTKIFIFSDIQVSCICRYHSKCTSFVFQLNNAFKYSVKFWQVWFSWALTCCGWTSQDQDKQRLICNWAGTSDSRLIWKFRPWLYSSLSSFM